MSETDLVEVQFRTRYFVDSPDLVVGVIGSFCHLGGWDPHKALLLRQAEGSLWWEGIIMLPLSEYFEWKLFIWDRHSKSVARWEERENHWDWINRGPVELTAFWNGNSIVTCMLNQCKFDKCICLTPYSPPLSLKNYELVTIRVLSKYCYIGDRQVLAVSGSTRYLGEWRPSLAQQFKRTMFQNDSMHCALFTIPMNMTVEWKLVLLDKRYRSVIAWEEHCNRSLSAVFENGGADSEICMQANWNMDEELVRKRSRHVEIDSICNDLNEQIVRAPVCGAENTASTGKKYNDDQAKAMTEKHVHFEENPVTNRFEYESEHLYSPPLVLPVTNCFLQRWPLGNELGNILITCSNSSSNATWFDGSSTIEEPPTEIAWEAVVVKL